MAPSRLLFAATLACVAFAAAAQTFPTKPVRLVVGFAPGGVADITARVVAQKLSEQLGQQVIVDNRPSAGGIVAAEAVAKAEPDGHTLLLMTNGNAVSASLFRTLPYDTQADFAPVSTLGFFDVAVVVPADSKLDSLPALLAYAKANPGKLNYASVGPGSSSHLNGELLKSLAGIDIVHVPFNGSPPAVTSTVQGETQMIFAVMQPLQAQVQAGKLRALAVTSAKRFPQLPDLPTIAESGYPAFESLAWNGVLVRAGTPKAVVDRLNAEINAVLKMPDVVQKMNAAGFELIGGTPEAFGALIRAESDKWAPVIKSAGIKID